MLLFHDCTERIGKVDKQLCDYIAGQYKPCVFVVNKWDKLAGQMPTEKWVMYLHDTYRTMRYAPIAFITAETGKNVKALLNHSQMLFKQARSRVGTGALNRMLREAVKRKRRRFIRIDGRRSTTPRRSARSPQRLSCFAASRLASMPPTSGTCSINSATNSTSTRCLSSSTSAGDRRTTFETMSVAKPWPTLERRRIEGALLQLLRQPVRKTDLGVGQAVPACQSWLRCPALREHDEANDPCGGKADHFAVENEVPPRLGSMLHVSSGPSVAPRIVHHLAWSCRPRRPTKEE